LLFLFLGAVLAQAQVDYSTATLKGTVMDPQSAVIAGATVTATNTATGVSKSTKSGPNGSYQIPALPPATYEITFEAEGFSKTVIKNIELTVGQALAYDAHLTVGMRGETVEVGPDAVPLIQVEQTQQANTINSRQVEDLPNINRAFTYDVYTLPGVSNSEATRSQNPGFTGYLTTGFSIGGSNGRNNLSTIDGGENEYGTGQYRVTNLPVDAIQEYQVNRNGFAAEFGFTNGSAINIVTKTGSNNWHGDAFGFFRDQHTEATNFFNGLSGFPKAFSQNVYMGGGIGGPILQNKLFFYTSYEYDRTNTPNFGNANIINAPGVVGPSAAQTSYVNALLASGSPSLMFFASQITPGLKPLNNPALAKILNRDNGIFDNPDRLHNAITRFDYQPNERDSFNLRVGYVHNNFSSPADGIINGSPDGYGLFVRDFSILTTWSRTISPDLLNQVLVQAVPRNQSNAIPTNENGVNFSLGNLGAPGPGGTSTFGGPALLPYLAHQQRFQFEDNVTWTHGVHTLKFGVSYRPADYHVQDKLWFNPEFDFADGLIPLIQLAPAALQNQLAFFNFQLQHMAGAPTDFYGPGCSAASLANPASLAACIGPSVTNLSAAQSFAFGLPADVLAGFNNPVWTGWGHYFGSYFQDSWKLTPRLTMNAGVRLDYDSEPTPLGGNFYASPRLGFAWDPFGDHKTVIRAGSGIYVAPIDVLIPSYGSLLDGTGRYINEVLSILSPTNPRPAALWQNGIKAGELPFGHLTPADFAAVGINTSTPGASISYSAAPNYKNPYSIEASLSIDHQLAKNLSLELGYNMYHAVHLQMPIDTAYTQIPVGSPLCPTPACTDVTGGPLYVPNSTQFQHTTYSSNGSSIYHGMTASLTKRYTNGLQFQANYTWSKTLDDTIDFSSFQNWFRPSLLRSYHTISVFDVPQSFSAHAVYTLPFKASQGKPLSNILSDWTLSPLLTARSGLPFSIRTPTLANRVNPVNGTLFSSPMLDANYATPFLASRNDNRGAAFYSLDMSLQKTIFINRERGLRMNLIVQGTNLLNHVNFDKVNDVFDVNGFPANGIVQTARGPLNLITGPFTGLHGVVPTSPSQLTQPLFYSQADVPRQVQFGLKLAF
jgi:hypothetical protein